MRLAWQTLGIASVVMGVIGVALPLLPTVPFMILAAFAFAKANPAWEQRLLDHPRYGPPIKDWRERGAISRRGKTMALVALTASAIFGVLMLDGWAAFLPLGVALISGSWIATRPD